MKLHKKVNLLMMPFFFGLNLFDARTLMLISSASTLDVVGQSVFEVKW